MSMSRYELAGRLCRQVQIERLRRIGERAPESEGNPLDDLPAEDRENWLTMADAMLVLLDEYDNASRLHALANDWDRYGQTIKSPQWRDEMRRGVVVEIRALADRMWKDCRGD